MSRFSINYSFKLSVYIKHFSILILLLGLVACSGNQTGKNASILNDELFIEVLTTHLEAVSTKNIEQLKSTLPPDNTFYLILPGSKTQKQKSDFIDFHEEWFQDTSWTYEAVIVDTEIGSDLGIAIVDVFYREPLRDGKPYFNHMTVSYALKKFDGLWRIMLDHASSIERSTG